jgi:2-C-methyl-D-erythritol 4-phosphate cytidylyltransferase
VLRAAFTGAIADASDCASLVERRGGRVCVVEGDPRLLKITSREDLDLVASWL